MDLVTYVKPSGITASSAKELFGKLGKVSLETVFFHLVGARLRLNALSNDFSVWLEQSCGREDLALAINGVNPHHYTLAELRDRIREIGLNA